LPGPGINSKQKEDLMDIKSVKLTVPEDSNIIVGQTHFIKTVEDIYEIMAGSVPGVEFGLAFCEASGPCLIRTEGNSRELIDVAVKNAQAVSAGHVFFLVMRKAFPINVLNAIKACQEVCSIFCATANPVEVIVAEGPLGSGILGVIDGSSPKGVETAEDREDRKKMLRKFSYKL
jgi:adenosine/AMP kinase